MDEHEPTMDGQPPQLLDAMFGIDDGANAAQPENRVQRLNTQRGRHSITHGGFHYHFEKSSLNGDVDFFTCTKKKQMGCMCRAHVQGDQLIRLLHNHNHGSDGCEAVVRTIRHEVRNLAATSSNSVEAIVGQCLEGASACVANGVGVPKNVKRVVQRTRNQEQGFPAQPRNLEELVLPQTFCTIQSPNGQEDFLKYDSGPGSDRILVFTTNLNVELLGMARQIFSDGTFDAAPQLFQQLYTIHAVVHEHVRPLVYALLPNKTEVTYIRLFQQVRNLCPTMHPEEWMTDFEKAAQTAIRRVFGVICSGCLFHLGQCVHRRTMSAGLKRLYDAPDGEFSLWIRCLPALAFVPPDNVAQEFAGHVQAPQFPAEAAPVATYFEKTWIGTPQLNGQRTEPVFPLTCWNVRQRTLDGDMRTNNSVEAWHRRFASILDCHSPNIFRLLAALKKEQESQRVLIEQARGGIRPDRKRCYKDLDERLRTVARGYGAPDYPTCVYLRGIGVNRKL